MDKKELIKRLKPFWEERNEEEVKFVEKEEEIEKKMNNELKKELGIDIEFFYVDGECVGIGAISYKDRENFDLISDFKLG